MKNSNPLILEEQENLDKVIHEMDEAILRHHTEWNYADLKAKQAKERNLPDAYGDLISYRQMKDRAYQELVNLHHGRDELYSRHYVLDLEEREEEKKESGEIAVWETKKSRIDIKVGLHTFSDEKGTYIYNWNSPICREFVLNPEKVEFERVEKEIKEFQWHTFFKMCLSREVDIFFDEVQDVLHRYPITTTEEENIIYDRFLKELAERRAEQEFRNIVFSIQKQQGEIIKTPLRQNLIVQGCAGSGKSMIMLHRLPIILTDNPNTLKRDKLYIISPSAAYIQLADQMRRDLEIEDLTMGTLEEYYESLLDKYHFKKSKGINRIPFPKDSESFQAYVYSENCLQDIEDTIKQKVGEGFSKKEDLFNELGIENSEYTNTGRKKIEELFPSEQIHEVLLAIQGPINHNDSVLTRYFREIRQCCQELNNAIQFLLSRRNTIIDSFKKQISKENRSFDEKYEYLSKRGLDSRIKEEIKKRDQALDRIQKEIEKVYSHTEYFDALREKAKWIHEYLTEYTEYLRTDQEKIPVLDQFAAVLKKDDLSMTCFRVAGDLETIKNEYPEYTKAFDFQINQLTKAASTLQFDREDLISINGYSELVEIREYFVDLQNNMVTNIYEGIVSRLNESESKKYYYPCSEYLLLQILYRLQGPPKAEMERLITIDEAQNISPLELMLMKQLNKGAVTFNLFGDVRQHIEGTKGIDSWEDFSTVADFSVKSMEENYRNARQITEYCNRRFGMTMRAINLDGQGVHELSGIENFENCLWEHFRKPQSIGLHAIIVSNTEEAQYISERFDEMKNKIHDMTVEASAISSVQWNLLTVKQARGLEFTMVIAVTGNMTDNEKYIAYTRALDELYVFDETLPVSENNPNYQGYGLQQIETKTNENSDQEKVDTGRRKRKSKMVQDAQEPVQKSEDLNNNATVQDALDLKGFLLSKGMEVLDARDTAGILWVLGEKEIISEVVNEAVKKYGVSGFYGSGQSSGYRKGWFTRSKK